jgi:hypothetical protein
MGLDTIIYIYEKRLNKTTYCLYGAYLQNWSNYGWVFQSIKTSPTT